MFPSILTEVHIQVGLSHPTLLCLAGVWPCRFSGISGSNELDQNWYEGSPSPSQLLALAEDLLSHHMAVSAVSGL